MTDDEILARVLRRFLVSDEYWNCTVSEKWNKGDITLDGSVDLSVEEARTIRSYNPHYSTHPEADAF